MLGGTGRSVIRCIFYVFYVLMLVSCETVEPTEKDWIVVGDKRVELHHRHKRFVDGGIPPRFLQGNYVVSERDGTLVNFVCVVPGTEIIEVAIFDALGPQDRCFRFPCPTARAGVDFVPVDIFRVLLKPDDKMFCFSITILNDNNVDGREFFLLALQDLRTLDILDTTVVTINDDDDPSLTEPNMIVTEATGNTKICVRGGTEDVPIKMEILPEASTGSMTALNADFAINFENGTEALLRAEEEVCFDITIIEDGFSEPIETVQYLVTQGHNTSVMFNLEGTLYILDNDPRPQFDTHLVYVPEDVGSLMVCINFAAPSSVVVRSQLFTLTMTASDLLDYTPVSDTFDIEGQTNQCRTIEIMEDEIPENVESFKVLLYSNNSQFPPDEMTVRIYDNDYLEFGGSSKTYTVAEDSAALELCVVYSGANLTSTINGILFTRPVTAKSNEDFKYIFRSVQLSQSDRMCFNVTLIDDEFAEPTEEFKVYLYTLGTGIVHIDVVTVFIEDNGDSRLW